jgi:hypothetical protein
MSRSITKNNKLYKKCPNFSNVSCDCKEDECKTRVAFNLHHQQITEVEDLQTPLKKFFKYMVENNYWIGNDLVNTYRDLVQEEKDLLKKLMNDNNTSK